MMAFDITQRPVARTSTLASRGDRSMMVAVKASWRVSSRMPANIG